LAVSNPESGVHRGLTTDEVAARRADGLINTVSQRSSRSFLGILSANVLTRFNAILTAMLVIVIVFGQLTDALFAVVMVVNAAVGIVQEVRAKRTLDALRVLDMPEVTVVRDGEHLIIATDEVVLDDLIELWAGHQVPVDGPVRSSAGLEIDESLLTGESLPVPKSSDDQALSGSVVVAGHGFMQATGIGEEAYAARLAQEARTFRLTASELRVGIDRILSTITWLLVPAGALVFWSERRSGREIDDSLIGMVAGVIGMVPQGLILLTSMAMAVAVIRLARRQTLVQELPAVEGLARIDTLCVDKTGTLTSGDITLAGVEVLAQPDDASQPDDPAETVLAAIAGSDDHPNATLAAIAESSSGSPSWGVSDTVAFSSARKWSAVEFVQHGAWYLGAPEVLLSGRAEVHAGVLARVADLAGSGERVLLLAAADRLAGEDLPAVVRPVALVRLVETLRPDADETLQYFRRQDVSVRVVSGDNAETVGAIAARLGIPGAEHPVDARSLPEDPDELREIVEHTTVFGRVTPEQKRDIVIALQEAGHTVAMTGDGVNDVPSIKQADIGVAMGSGTDATRAIAQVILLDNRFATLPHVVAEGRRVVANIERVATLFLTKTVYSVVLAFAIGALLQPFPFLPRHLSVVSVVTIGIPAFAVSFRASAERARPGFLRRVMRFSLPAGSIAAGVVLLAYGYSRSALSDATLSEARTTATVALTGIGFWILFMVGAPLTKLVVALNSLMVGLFALAFVLPSVSTFYALDLPTTDEWWVTGIVMAAGFALLSSLSRWMIGGYRS